MIHTNIAEETEMVPEYEPVAMEAAPEHELVTLRRSGKRPIAFRGAVVANAMSFRVGTPFWYELNVFKTATGGYVANVRHFTKADGETDRFEVCVAEGLEAVLDFFEGYQPSHDVAADLPLDDAEISVSELALKALSLRLKVEEAKSQYEAMVSEIFAQLEAEAGA